MLRLCLPNPQRAAVQGGWLDSAQRPGQRSGMNATLAPFAAPDADWLVDRHAALYARDEGFDDSFGALVHEIVTAFLARHDPAIEGGWIARADGQRLGSIFVVQEIPGVAKLRLFLLEPEARGTGLAQRMLEHAMAFARGAGYRHMRLWTHESHRAAGRLYARNGFALTGAEARRSFGRDVVAQTWERAL
jgi:GNAT superfamily N-acetyltransferase